MSNDNRNQSYAKLTESLFGEIALVIPDYEDNKEYPGGIKPGRYTMNEVVDLLRIHSFDPEAIQFIADMMEV